MSHTTAYDRLLDAISKIPETELRSATMPMSVFLQEAEDLYHWCQQDHKKLLDAGLDWELVDGLPDRIDATREAHARWTRIRFTDEGARQRYYALAPESYELREDLVHSLRYALRSDAASSMTLEKIAVGRGGKDVIDDLIDLAQLAKDNSDTFDAIGASPTLRERAETRGGELSSLVAEQFRAQDAAPGQRLIRDQAYTYLRRLVDEIRACGQYLFWREPARVRGYESDYSKHARRISSVPLPRWISL